MLALVSAASSCPCLSSPNLIRLFQFKTLVYPNYYNTHTHTRAFLFVSQYQQL